VTTKNGFQLPLLRQLVLSSKTGRNPDLTNLQYLSRTQPGKKAPPFPLFCVRMIILGFLTGWPGHTVQRGTLCGKVVRHDRSNYLKIKSVALRVVVGGSQWPLSAPRPRL